MNAIGRLQAAIEKLEAAKLAHNQGSHIDIRDASDETVLFEWALAILRRDERTIDAQLAILRAAHGSLIIAPGWVDGRAVERALALADAILGGDS